MDNRRFPRVAGECNMVVRPLDDASESGLSRPSEDAVMSNISGGGVSFVQADAIEDGAMLALELELPGFPTSVISMGKVVWCRPKDDEYEIGVEFWWVGWRDHEAQKKIGEYITRSLKQPTSEPTA